MAHTRVPGSAQRLGLGERVLDGEEVLLEAHPLPVQTLASSQDQNLALTVKARLWSWLSGRSHEIFEIVHSMLGRCTQGRSQLSQELRVRGSLSSEEGTIEKV